MKRPPSRSAKPTEPQRKTPNNVVQLFPRQARPKKEQIKASRRNFRAKEKRLNRRIRPTLSFGKKVIVATFVGLIALVATVAVASFSPLLAVKKIEVVGATRVNQADILKDLSSFKGVPLPQITSSAIAVKLSKYQLIDSVSAISLPPNTLRVVVIERAPIGVVQVNGIDYLYDPTGIQIGRAGSSDKYPLINSVGNPATSNGFKQAVAVLMKIPVNLLSQVSVVSAASRDSVELQLRNWNQKIIWGDYSKPGLKAKVLEALMKHYQGQYGITYDVSAPGQPSVY